jgi:acetyl-CoA acyltransferase
MAISMDKEYPLSMREAVIVEAVRAPIGKRNGGLSGVHVGRFAVLAAGWPESVPDVTINRART